MEFTENFLKNLWETEKFSSSWIVSTKDISSTFGKIKNFAHEILGVKNLPIENNPDFRLIECGLNSSGMQAKYINIEQIRELQSFMNSTSSVSNCKISVILEADRMNINACNCCLKVLEEAPRDSYIFLVTKKPGNIIPTIKSRCVKIADSGSSLAAVKNIEDLEQIITSSSRIEKINYLQEITAKDSKGTSDAKKRWQDFCDAILEVARKNGNHGAFDAAYKLIQDVQDFDLDKKQMGILLISLMC